MPSLPVIPEYITVHLGRPDSNAENVTVTFPDYLKNVASSEIYPTWPESALRANIYAQASFALNRIYTEWYRSRGYDFDITNSTAYDQSYVPNRDIFDSVSRIVDEQFNSYVRRRGTVEPLFTLYCDGRVANCNGLKQLETPYLANQGYSPLQMLKYYYGDDIEIVSGVPVQSIQPSYPSSPLRMGDAGNDVQQLQIRLNRVARNYPGIPKIYPVNGVYSQATVDAVRAFQRIFGLTEDGVVGQATWNRLAYIYASVKRLAELDSEGLTLAEIPNTYPGSLRQGDRGELVRQIQYFIAVIGKFYDTVRPIDVDGIFGTRTANAVRDFQTQAGLTVDGIVGRQTWRAIYDTYNSIVASGVQLEGGIELFPGETLAVGSSGENVRTLQTYLEGISGVLSDVPRVSVDGVFGRQTENAVKAVQRLYGLNQDGIVGPITWDTIASLYSDLLLGYSRRPGQFLTELS